MTKDNAIARAKTLVLVDHIPRWVIVDDRGQYFIARREAIDIIEGGIAIVWSSGDGALDAGNVDATKG